jgi:hypothetical protein
VRRILWGIKMKYFLSPKETFSASGRYWIWLIYIRQPAGGDIAVGMLITLWIGGPRSHDSIPDSGKMFIPCSNISDQPSCSFSPLFSGHQELLPRKYRDWSANLTVHHHLVSKLRVCGTTPPVLRIPLCVN